MVINIWKNKDIDVVQELPKQVKELMRENLKILEENYGTERTVEDLGGYIALVDEVGLEELKEHQLKGIIPEYIDEIEGANYITALFLCSNDFAKVIFCEDKLREKLEQ